MRCQDFTTHATELMEGALGWRQRLAMRMHLAICDACRTFLQQMRRTVRLVGALPPPAPPPEVEAQVIAGLRRDDPDRPA
jgi:hypothetical protein